MHELLRILGIDDVSGPWYAFWSGIGGDLGLVGAALLYIRHKNCHVKWCPRLQWKQLSGTGHMLCKHHHPHDPPRANEL